MNWKGESRRILDFDCECRPITFLGSDFMTKEITAIAWGWTDEDDVKRRMLHHHDTEQGYWDEIADMLTDFEQAYDEAAIVTGHYIRGFDLTLLNGARQEVGLGPLARKLTSDTKNDLYKSHGISLSQESLGAMMRIGEKKESMDQALWRTANRLTIEGLAETERRVVGDVKQHKVLRAELLEGGWLGPARAWGGAPALSGGYKP